MIKYGERIESRYWVFKSVIQKNRKALRVANNHALAQEKAAAAKEKKLTDKVAALVEDLEKVKAEAGVTTKPSEEVAATALQSLEEREAAWAVEKATMEKASRWSAYTADRAESFIFHWLTRPSHILSAEETDLSQRWLTNLQIEFPSGRQVYWIPGTLPTKKNRSPAEDSEAGAIRRCVVVVEMARDASSSPPSSSKGEPRAEDDPSSSQAANDKAEE